MTGGILRVAGVVSLVIVFAFACPESASSCRRCLCVIQVSFCVAELVSRWSASLFVLSASLFVGAEPALGDLSRPGNFVLSCLALPPRAVAVKKYDSHLEGWPSRCWLVKGLLGWREFIFRVST